LIKNENDLTQRKYSDKKINILNLITRRRKKTLWFNRL